VSVPRPIFSPLPVRISSLSPSESPILRLQRFQTSSSPSEYLVFFFILLRCCFFLIYFCACARKYRLFFFLPLKSSFPFRPDPSPGIHCASNYRGCDGLTLSVFFSFSPTVVLPLASALGAWEGIQSFQNFFSSPPSPLHYLVQSIRRCRWTLPPLKALPSPFTPSFIQLPFFGVCNREMASPLFLVAPTPGSLPKTAEHTLFFFPPCKSSFFPFL